MIFFNIQADEQGSTFFQFGIGAVLVDTVPLAPINKDYFEQGGSA